ncbi:MAG: SPOR domain-containing protein [Christensenellales bacterium]|jgi:hypothetical protein
MRTIHSRRPVRSGAPRRNTMLLAACLTTLILVIAYLGNVIANKIIVPMAGYAEPAPTAASAAPPAQSAAPAAPTVQVTLETQGLTVYALQCGVYEQSDNAATQALALSQRGGAGYVLRQDKQFRVLLAGYPQQADAERVIEQLKAEGVEAELYTIAIDPIRVKITAREDYAKQLQSLFETYESLLTRLGALSVSVEDQVDQGAGELARIRAELTGLSTTLDPICEASGSNALLTRLQSLLASVGAQLDALKAGNGQTNGQTGIAFFVGIKYTYLDAVIGYQQLLREFGA